KLPRQLGRMCRWLRLVDAAQWIEQRVGRRRIGDAIACAGERAKAHLNELIAAIAEGDLVWLQAEVLRDRDPGGLSGWARVEAKGVVGSLADRLDDPWRRRQGRFVGVELDPILAVGRLLTRKVGLAAGEGR